MRKSQGFTLIELLVVISIISLLSSIVIVSLSGVRERARLSGADHFNASLFRVIGSEALGYWNFNEASGSTYRDVTNAHNGTAGGSPLPSWTTDTPTGNGTAMYFYSGTGYIATAGTITTQSPNITISAWIKTTSASDMTIFSLRGGGNIFFGMTQRRLYVYINNSNIPVMTSSAVIADGKWHHVAWTGNGSKSVIYVDGQIDSTLVRTNTAVTGIQAYIAKDVEYAAGYAGFMDDVAVYNTTMLSSEINHLYVAGLQSRAE